jgi:hypothetical protein
MVEKVGEVIKVESDEDEDIDLIMREDFQVPTLCILWA